MHSVEKGQRVLIFQIGSLGDTVIAMPCYREIARRHPRSSRYLLTNFPIGVKMVQAEAMLGPCGLIDACVAYPMPLRGLRKIAELYRKLRELRIDILYYLTPEKRTVNLLRHAAFFRLCGIRDLRGLPWSRNLRFPRLLSTGALWESEASRLLRAIGAQRSPKVPDPKDRSLDLTAGERDAADQLLGRSLSAERFIAVSVGGKVPINNWGDENWAQALASISAAQPGLGAVFIGSADERDRNQILAAAWSGPKLNSCGSLTPRETAALIARAALFIGHDTGTLHLAAAVDTRVIGIYSARNVPGKWYSDRPGDRFFYNRPPCFGCELERTADCPHDLVCMKHSVTAIVASVTEALTHA